MGSLFVWIPNMEKNDGEAVLEVKRRVRWGVCVGDPERETGGGRFMTILVSLCSSAVPTRVMVLEEYLNLGRSGTVKFAAVVRFKSNHHQPLLSNSCCGNLWRILVQILLSITAAKNLLWLNTR